MNTKIKNLSEEEHKKLTSHITSIIEEEKNVSEAIYINSFYIKDIVHINIQFIKPDIYYVKKEIINCPIRNIIIYKIDIPSIVFTYSLEYYLENCHPMNLLNSEIVKDTDDNKYEELSFAAGGFGFGSYNNNVTFNPQLKLKKVYQKED